MKKVFLVAMAAVAIILTLAMPLAVQTEQGDEVNGLVIQIEPVSGAVLFETTIQGDGIYTICRRLGISETPETLAMFVRANPEIGQHPKNWIFKPNRAYQAPPELVDFFLRHTELLEPPAPQFKDKPEVAEAAAPAENPRWLTWGLRFLWVIAIAAIPAALLWGEWLRRKRKPATAARTQDEGAPPNIREAGPPVIAGGIASQGDADDLVRGYAAEEYRQRTGITVPLNRFTILNREHGNGIGELVATFGNGERRVRVEYEPMYRARVRMPDNIEGDYFAFDFCGNRGLFQEGDNFIFIPYENGRGQTGPQPAPVQSHPVARNLVQITLHENSANFRIGSHEITLGQNAGYSVAPYPGGGVVITNSDGYTTVLRTGTDGRLWIGPPREKEEKEEKEEATG